MTPKLFGREPALWIQAVSTLLALAVGFGWLGMTGTLAATITSIVVAVFAVWQAFTVQPVAPTVFSGLILATVPLAAHFGLNLSEAQVGMMTAVVAAVMALFVRGQSTPVNDPAHDAIARR